MAQRLTCLTSQEPCDSLSPSHYPAIPVSLAVRLPFHTHTVLPSWLRSCRRRTSFSNRHKRKPPCLLLEAGLVGRPRVGRLDLQNRRSKKGKLTGIGKDSSLWIAFVVSSICPLEQQDDIENGITQYPLDHDLG